MLACHGPSLNKVVLEVGSKSHGTSADGLFRVKELFFTKWKNEGMDLLFRFRAESVGVMGALKLVSTKEMATKAVL